MLSKKERLKRVDFNRFFSLGRRNHSQYYTLIYSPASSFHASVVVSKKIAKKATTRNKIRRRIYDMLRRHARMHAISGVYIIVMKVPALTATYEALKTSLEGTIGQIHNKS